MTGRKKINWVRWSLLALVLAGLGGTIAIFWDKIDWHALRQSMEQMDRVPLLALVSVLPLFGFSVGIVYLVVGAVFGGWLGMAVVAGITAVHLIGSHFIAHSLLRKPLERFVKKGKHKLPELPEGADGSIALMTALVPGLPYFVRNYLLALSGIPLRTYFWICWPVYVIRSALVIFLGDFSGDFSATKAATLGGVLLVKVAICAFIIHRLRARHKAKHHSPGGTPHHPKKQAA